MPKTHYLRGRVSGVFLRPVQPKAADVHVVAFGRTVVVPVSLGGMTCTLNGWEVEDTDELSTWVTGHRLAATVELSAAGQPLSVRLETQAAGAEPPEDDDTVVDLADDE